MEKTLGKHAVGMKSIPLPEITEELFDVAEKCLDLESALKDCPELPRAPWVSEMDVWRLEGNLIFLALVQYPDGFVCFELVHMNMTGEKPVATYLNTMESNGNCTHGINKALRVAQTKPSRIPILGTVNATGDVNDGRITWNEKASTFFNKA